MFILFGMVNTFRFISCIFVSLNDNLITNIVTRYVRFVIYNIMISLKSVINVCQILNPDD